MGAPIVIFDVDGTLADCRHRAVEDRARVVRMWREVGLVCLQCADGDF